MRNDVAEKGILMKINEIAVRLGIEKYPPELDVYCETDGFKADNTFYADENFLTQADEKYDLFGNLKQDVLEIAKDIKADKDILLWLNLGVKYLAENADDAEKCKAFPLPKKAQKNTSVDVFPLILLMSQIDSAKQRYLSRGVPENEADNNISAFGKCFKSMSERFGRAFLPLSHFNWLCNYVSARIFNIAGFNFEVRTYPCRGVYIKNRQSSELVPLMLNEKMHKSGLVLGTAGCEDENGSWFASYEETEEAFCGFASDKDGIVHNEKKICPKTEWELFLKPGDDMISFHIPKKADFTPENLDKAFKEGCEKVKQYYPEKNIKCLLCSSWLVSPQLKSIMKPTSNIVAFAERFTPFPQKNDGKAVFSFVFPAGIERYEDLPENTSLERALKKLYLEGKYIYTYPGVFEI